MTGNAVYSAVPLITATPTPTPTRAPGTSNTPTPTPTSTPPISCVPKAYHISNGGTFYWTDCNGIDRRDVFNTDDDICICSSNNLPVSQDGGTGYLLGGGCTCESATPTPTPTQTQTPTSTPIYYWFKLRRCDMDPSDPSNVYWTLHSYVHDAMTYGDLFKSGGGYYYTVVDHALTNQGGNIDGDKTNDYLDCNSVPGHWVAPPPLPGQSLGAITGTTYNSSTEACNNYQSGFEGNLWLSGTSTPDVGLFFFTGQDCGTTFTGNSNWYYVFRGATEYAIRIGGTGYISEVVPCGGTSPSPTPTPTPTHVVNPATLNSYDISYNITYPTGCNGYADETQIYTITLKDQYGNPFNATSNLTFTFSYDYVDNNDYGGSTGSNTRDITILSGHNSGSTTFNTLTYYYCNYSSMCDGTCYGTESNISLITVPNEFSS
jgi:hypothetical protein